MFRHICSFAFLSLSATIAFSEETLSHNLAKNWEIRGKAKWSIENGVITGSQNGNPKNSGMLISKRAYRDFTLTFDFKIDEHGKYNSGVYLRWQPTKGPKLQLNIGRGVAGEPVGLYLDDWLDKGDAEDKYRKPGEWNQVELTIVKDKITSKLNGHQIIDYEDSARLENYLASGKVVLQTYGAEGHDGWVKYRKFKVSRIIDPAIPEPPYDIVPKVKPPYYRIRYPASSDSGELIFPVKYTIWIPPGLKMVRGVIVHQHGCGEGSCKSGLTGAWDLHWQALAKKHDCALMAPSYEQLQSSDCQMWCDPRNGSAKSFQNALKDLGRISGHPELEKVPWTLWGHSGGGHWAGGMTMLYPEKVLACWLHSGVPLFKPNPDRPLIKVHELSESALKVPIMCNPGTKEGVTVKDGRFAKVWPANESFLKALRSKDGRVAVAVDPLSAHECGNQRYFAIPWFDFCLENRLPNSIDDPLRDISDEESWYAPFLGKKAISGEAFQGDKRTFSWFPNEKIAQLWEYYVRDTEVPDFTPPPPPMNLTVEGNRITWEAEADLESGLARFIVFRDDSAIGVVPKENRNPFGRPIFQGLQYSDTPNQPLAKMEFIDSDAQPAQTTLTELSARIPWD